MTAEHIKLAHPNIIHVITHIANKILHQSKIPDDLKLGLITPVLKKQKPKHDPDSYRRITVSSMLMKIIEKEILPKTRHASEQRRSKNQFGFKPHVSCSNAAMLLTEAIMDAKDAKCPLYICYMDASKAFDIVDHDVLLSTMHNQGISGPLWHLYDSAYNNIRSVVKWQGKLSSEFSESQGIRQGGSTSADAFIIKADPLLHKLSCQPEGYRIGISNIGAIMVADDLTLSSSSTHGLQVLVNIAEHDASAQRYIFSESKTKVQTTNTKLQPNINIHMNTGSLTCSAEETHLGIQRCGDLSNKSTIESRIKTARRTVYALMGAGMYGLNGISPVTSKKLIDIYILPRLTYGLECLVLTPKELIPIEAYYRELLRHIQHLPTSTANSACYLLLGALPIEALIHIKTLIFFGSLMKREDSLEYEIIERQLAVKDASSHSWAVYVKGLLKKYNLPRAVELLYSMKTKHEWKKCVKHHIQNYWMKQIIDDAKAKSTLEYLITDKCGPGKIHNVWVTSTDPLIINRATIHVKLLVQRYPINTNQTQRQSNTLCPCCHLEDETLDHFILKCKKHCSVRHVQLPKIISILESFNIAHTSEKLVQILLDATSLPVDSQIQYDITSLSRDLFFNLHLSRMKSLNGTISFHSMSGRIKETRNILNN